MRALFVMALTVVGCGGPLEESEESEASLARRLNVRVSNSAGHAKGRARFEIDATNTLYLSADVRAGHTVAFEVTEPGGAMWQRSEVVASGRAGAVTSMPVAGTWIQQYALTGTWSVLVFVDAASSPAGQAAFELY